MATSTKKKLSETTSNLRVAVRVRPMNSFEREDKCTNITKVDKYKLSVNCKGKPFGPFFRVYDSDTTQSEVYEDLVASQIKKVIAGFNCTVFAYGQTGTGKTFTMEGGRTDVKSSKDDETTGIIPRAVEDIFEQLEASGCEEYSLRVSYVELYNEELFDLLAANTIADDRERLRIYDDPNKKGVIVSGVEEVPVRNRADVFKLLAAGAEKRRTAATLMNLCSSRSHSLFMVNVVVRENTISGEELVKQGKLNLVDLAGSENIGRSGAQGNRAKEAGSINQSLLTLGRVIRSLTTSAQHIPYRESKLTRLLQDSLGGSTITSLIATMSPASSNFEESQSTLEYAMRAANIKNKPVCNSKVSKKTILKEYSDEIEKLRRDLRAAREKNGVIISEESHEEFQRNTEKVRELEEQLDTELVKMKRFIEDLSHMDDQYKKLFDRKDQLEERLRIRLREMAEKEKELADTKDELAKYVKALENMHTAASQTFVQLEQMRNAADDMKGDLGTYWRKVDEMKGASDKNLATVDAFGSEMEEFVRKVMEKKESVVKMTRDEADNVFKSSDSPCKFLAETSSKVRSNSTRTTSIVVSNNELLAECEKKMIENVSEIGKDLKNQIKIHLTNFQELYTKITKESEEYASKLNTKLDTVKESVEEFRKDVDPLVTELRQIATDDVQRRREQRSEMRSNVDEKVGMMEQLLMKMSSELAELKTKTKEYDEKQEVEDSAAMEKTISTLATIGDVITGMEDIVLEETNDIEELRKESEESRNAYGIEVVEKSNETTAYVEKNINDIQNLMHGFESESTKTRCAFESEMNGLVEDNLKISPECDNMAQEMKQQTDSMADSLKSICDQFETSTNDISRMANETISNVKMENVDPSANVSARITPYVFGEQDMNTIPDPEDLLNQNIEEEEEDTTDEPDAFLIKKKRRVTGFIRRDSLLDNTNTNNFLSPQTIKVKREQAIEEGDEDMENY